MFPAQPAPRRPGFDFAQRRLALEFSAEASLFADALARRIGAATGAGVDGARAAETDDRQGRSTESEPAEPIASSRCIAEILESFQCPIRHACLVELSPGEVVEAHGGAASSLPDGEECVHVVLAAEPALEFHLDGQWIVLERGECWYLDLARPHRMHNRGSTSLIRLVVNLKVNDWLRRQFAAGDQPARVPARPSGTAEFARFRERVWVDPGLSARLRMPASEENFILAAVREGQRSGFAFEATDVFAALAEGRRRWLERWLP